jgi:squalene-associated FAD-dependent desaturase
MTIHIVGAGLSGLAAAVWLADAGAHVSVYEAAAQAGGRCRSYFDRELGRVIDNGNHLLLSGNGNVLKYLRLLGAQDRLVGPAGDGGFRFLDLASNRDFVVHPNPGPVPWWIASPERRIPGTRAFEYLSVLRLALARAGATVAEALPHDELFRVLWEPLAVSALNTPVGEASARGFWQVLLRTLVRGGKFAQPLIARDNLADTFIAPALEFLERKGGVVRFGARVRRILYADRSVAGLALEEGEGSWRPGDGMILAAPPSVAERLVPRLETPCTDEPIVNAHFATEGGDDGPLEIVAIVGGAAQWVFRRPGLTSVTVSAARAMVELPAEILAPRLWADVARAFPSLGQKMPAYRIIKEKRATIRQSPTDEAARPPAATAYGNLWLAGDWTATGLPATIEGSILSGFRAAKLALAAGAR